MGGCLPEGHITGPRKYEDGGNEQKTQNGLLSQMGLRKATKFRFFPTEYVITN
jgi:hypothetical protein